MTAELIFAGIAVSISIFSLFLSRQDKGKERLDELTGQLNVINVENNVIKERLRNTINQSDEMSKKLDKIIDEVKNVR